MRITSADATAALCTLAEAAAFQQQDVNRFSNYADVKSDEEDDSHCPILDSFYLLGGSQSKSDITNLAPREVDHIWKIISTMVDTRWNAGRGQKNGHSGNTVLFIMLIVLKHVGKWDFLDKLFKIKGWTLKK